ncbi:MAG: PpiC-type peptidyl-prolyl cis-trans isomerase [Symbiobacteriaceae bacterium]|jgi:foldase protein PrsA|nr:PpiC-type peptidyl-prolyl cis-trans isomerase [Symbiobacteriaceae bacterium]
MMPHSRGKHDKIRIDYGLTFEKEELSLSNANKGAGIVAAVLITLIVAAPGGYMLGKRSGEKAASIDTAAVATVNGENITKLDIYNLMVAEQGASIVDQIIQNKLVDQEAKKNNVTVSPAEIDQEIAKIRERMGGEVKFQEALTTNGISLEQLREYQDFRVKVTKLLKPQITLQEEAVKTFFEENKSQFDKRKVHARHILVETEEEAKAIKTQLQGGADFAALAKEKSTEPAAATSGGDLGTFGAGAMLPAFENVVFNLKVNEISAPFQTDYGWHVAQVLETTGTAPTFEGSKAEATELYIDSKVQELLQPWLTELKDKAKITNSLEKGDK